MMLMIMCLSAATVQCCVVCCVKGDCGTIQEGEAVATNGQEQVSAA